ncbi:MAG: adenylate/guanylate cyclase domain-containing protein [Chloroflexota bacterium]
MSLLCKHCQSTVPDGMRYCGYCGARLTDPPFFPETQQRSQLRHVTVLFADLVGYTQAANRLDSEVLYELVQQYTDLLSREVYKYEGVIDKMTGDGIMALFGAPVSYENNAERAVRAALDMQANFSLWRQQILQHLGVDLNLRIGLHSGPVIVGEIGSNIVMDYTAIGETVNLAYRIEELAEPGHIYTSSDVANQTKALFEYTEIPNLTVKGFTQPITCYKILGLKSKPDSIKTPESLRAPLIGRESELGQLLEAIRTVQEGKRGKFILITGEAGIGKSRLLLELKEKLKSLQMPFIEGHSLTYRRSVPYWIFTDLIRHDLAIPSEVTPAELSRQLKQALQTHLPDQAEAVLPYIEVLFSLPNTEPSFLLLRQNMEAYQFRENILNTLRAILLRPTDSASKIWILEDLHWADEASLNILLTFLSELPDLPLLIIAATRLESGHPLQTVLEWMHNSPNDISQEMKLASLSPAQSKELLAHFVDVERLPQELILQILEHSAGVPLFMEEILRMLMDAAVLEPGPNGLVPRHLIETESLGVPVSLQGLIQARFDQLTPFQRKVLQAASIIGHHFSRSLLEAVIPVLENEILDTALQTLVEREFIIPTPGNPQGEYAFRHMMISEAVYNTMLKKERSQFHALVGLAIESQYSGRINEVIEVLARHFSWSNQTEKALHYLILAGQKAAASSLLDQARKHYEHALALLPLTDHTPQQAIQVHIGLGDLYALNTQTTEARAHYLAAMEAISNIAASDLQDTRNLLLRKLREITR